MKTNNACFECENGTYLLSIEAYKVTTDSGEELTVPAVEILRCDSCGDEILTPETSAFIQSYLAKEQDLLGPADIEKFMEATELTQMELAMICGVGVKTISRWINGRQFVSKSMSYYIRVLQEFPQTREWLKNKGWRKPKQETELITSKSIFRFYEMQTSRIPRASRFCDPRTLKYTRRNITPTRAFLATR